MLFHNPGVPKNRQKSPTDDPQRRHYPKENHGGENEWKAIVKQGEEYNSVVTQIERDFRQKNIQHFKYHFFRG